MRDSKEYSPRVQALCCVQFGQRLRRARLSRLFAYDQMPNKNVSSTYKIANWLSFKSSELYTTSGIKYHTVGRIALASIGLLSSAEAISRITLGSMALSMLGCDQKAKSSYISQIQKGIHASSISLACFRSIISPAELVYHLEDAKPRKILPPKKRLNRIRQGEKLIADKLQKQLNCAQAQAAREPNKAFKYLSAPENFEPNAFNRMIDDIEAGVCYYIGRRDSMEDEDLITSFELIVNNSTYPVQLFGVFDGHGGNWASCYVKKYLKHRLQEVFEKSCTNEFTDEAIWNTLKATFINLYSLASKEELPEGGTTATVAMILDKKLWVANVGDSRTILDNGCQLSEDAKPENPRYKRGIESRGGKVLTTKRRQARVEGKLSVARAIGDYHLKGINPRPKITMRPLSEIPERSHLILACDGIYDVSSTRQVATAVKAHKDCSAAELAKNIVYSAYRAGSKDNLTALVVKL